MTKKAKRPPPGIPFRSKLVPFEAHIRHWLKAGLSYREMAEKLRRDHSLTVHPDTINSFVLVRHYGRSRAMLPPSRDEAQDEPTAASGRPETPKGRGAAPGRTQKVKPLGPGMLPPQSSKYHDSSGQPIPPPQDPREFRSENL